MRERALKFFADLARGRLTNGEGATFELPAAILGDTWVCSTRFLDRDELDQVFRSDLKLVGLKATVGLTLTPPTSGGFRLRLDGSDTGVIDAKADDSVLKAALGAEAQEVVQPRLEDGTLAAGVWMIRLTQTGDVAARLTASPDTVTGYNTLAPLSFVRVRAVQRNRVWWHEVRLIQRPWAATTSFERILPPAPTVTEVESGAYETSETPAKNEVQALYIPREFEGTIDFGTQERRSAVIGSEGITVAIVAAALNGMWDDGATRFEVSNPAARTLHITFVGELGGRPQDNIAVRVRSNPPGPVVFRLPFDREEAAEALRAETTREGIFEVSGVYIRDDEDPEDEGVVPTPRTLWAEPIIFQREQAFPELEVVPGIDWAKRMVAESYVPFTPGQVITGSQHYTRAFGDGTARVYTFTHNLDTEAGHLTVRENTSGGRVLQPSEYKASFPSAAELRLEFAVAVGSNELAVTYTTAGPRSAFEAHGHPQAAIEDLEDDLDAIRARLLALEDIAPRLSVLEPTTTGAAQRLITIPDFEDTYPVKKGRALNPAKPPSLRRAIHRSTVDSITVPLPAAASNAGVVVTNDSGSEVPIPGLSGGSQSLRKDGLAACDGTSWWRAERRGTGKTFYPLDYARWFFVVPISAERWKPGELLDLSFQLDLGLISASTVARAAVLIEHGVNTDETSPATTGPNIKGVTWAATPLLEADLRLTNTKTPHTFGVRIQRAVDDTITAQKGLYGLWTSTSSAPATGQFLLAASLRYVDVQDDIAVPRGLFTVRASQIKIAFA